MADPMLYGSISPEVWKYEDFSFYLVSQFVRNRYVNTVNNYCIMESE